MKTITQIACEDCAQPVMIGIILDAQVAIRNISGGKDQGVVLHYQHIGTEDGNVAICERCLLKKLGIKQTIEPDPYARYIKCS